MYRTVRTFIIICGIIATTGAASILKNNQATTLENKNENDGKGNYRFSFVTSNGITRTEYGQLTNIGEPDEHIVVEGTYSYIDPNGEKIIVHYIADENGYQISEPEVTYIESNVLASLLGK